MFSYKANSKAFQFITFIKLNYTDLWWSESN